MVSKSLIPKSIIIDASGLVREEMNLKDTVS